MASRTLALGGGSLAMAGRLLGYSTVQATERYAHLASDWLKESVVCVAERIVQNILTGYPDLKTETLGEGRGGRTEEDHVIDTLLIPARIHARSRWAA